MSENSFCVWKWIDFAWIVGVTLLYVFDIMSFNVVVVFLLLTIALDASAIRHNT